jgi:stearoyl-CoA desaturase (delta-9 desaturase)
MDTAIADKHCVEIRKQWKEAGVTAAPNTLYSLSFWVRDIAIAVGLMWFFATFKETLAAYLTYPGAVALSAVVQGTAWTGLWVLGHECGHGAFSNIAVIETAVGYITHTALLVPYFSWQFTHAKHHRYTNHLTKGESHVPMTEKAAKGFAPFLNMLGEDGFAIFQVFGHLVFGWPLYLIRNDTGGRTQADLKTRLNRKKDKSHFIPNQIFPKRLHNKVAASTVGCVAMIALVIQMQRLGYDTLFFYWMPYLVTNGWLVLYTWLQHTDPSMPHYGDDEHTFHKGALSTIDRPYPWLIDQLHHHIGTTHVAHHLNHHIPHYRAQKATEIVANVLGQDYAFINKGIVESTYYVAKTCHYVKGVEGVQYMQSLCKSVGENTGKKEFVSEVMESTYKRSAELMNAGAEYAGELNKKLQGINVKFWFLGAIALYAMGSYLINKQNYLINIVGFVTVAYAMNQFYRCGYSCTSLVEAQTQSIKSYWQRWIVGQISLFVLLTPMSSMYGRVVEADEGSSAVGSIVRRVLRSFDPSDALERAKRLGSCDHPAQWVALQFFCLALFAFIFFPALFLNIGIGGIVRHWLIPFVVLHYQLGSFSRDGNKNRAYERAQDFFQIDELKVKMVQVRSAMDSYTVMHEGVEYTQGPHWFNLIYLSICHIMGFYGFYLGFTYCSWDTVLIAFLMYQFSGLGITAGAHRLWAHRTYKAHWLTQVFLMVANSMANQGSIYKWARDHRAHHKHVDTDMDPHNAENGFWYSHMGWLFSRKSPEVILAGRNVFTADLDKNKVVQFQKRNYPWFGPFMSFIFPCLVTGAYNGDYWSGFWVCGFARYIWVLHATWFVNSLAHLWGDRPYLPILPAENLFVSLCAMGEGWHNYHHAYPYDYSTSEYGMWKWNPTTVFLDTLAMFGLVTDRRKATVSGKKKIPDAELPEFTKEDVDASVDQAAYFIIVGDYVYDVATFLAQQLHPGGSAILKRYVGKDATETFYRGAKHAHTPVAFNLLDELKIGKLVESKKKTQ